MSHVSNTLHGSSIVQTPVYESGSVIWILGFFLSLDTQLINALQTTITKKNDPTAIPTIMAASCDDMCTSSE